jgi:hypothetical protein
MFRIRKSLPVRILSKRNYTSDANVANRNKFYFVLVPKLGVIIGLSALCFQIGVLYPWHIELSQEFAALEVYISIHVYM